MNDVKKNFLINRDETGNEVYFFPETGKKYYVEYIAPRSKQEQSNWGDLDPATKKVTGSYGFKYTGAIKESESVITKENGFDNIVEGEGASVAWKINEMHEAWKKENGF
jgi:hypothetical protein